MLAMVAMGNTASGMAAMLPRLPAAKQAAVVAEMQLNIRLTASALAQVESVALSAEGITIALVPNAVAMAAGGTEDAMLARWFSRPAPVARGNGFRRTSTCPRAPGTIKPR